MYILFLYLFYFCDFCVCIYQWLINCLFLYQWIYMYREIIEFLRDLPIQMLCLCCFIVTLVDQSLNWRHFCINLSPTWYSVKYTANCLFLNLQHVLIVFKLTTCFNWGFFLVWEIPAAFDLYICCRIIFKMWLYMYKCTKLILTYVFVN